MTKFIEDRAKLVRSLANQADPFIKRRLLALAERYEAQLATSSRATQATREIRMTPSFSVGTSASER
jgi:hypothetical protein